MKLCTGITFAALVVAGCSSRPREFTPMLDAAVSDQAAFDAAYQSCRVAVIAGKGRSRDTTASAGGGAAAGAATAAAGTAAATTAGGYTGLAVLGATVVALPLVAVAGAWGLAKKKKAKKENRIKAETAACLQENGFAVAGWQPASGAVAKARAAERRRTVEAGRDTR
jgi:hypothetical protein